MNEREVTGTYRSTIDGSEIVVTDHPYVPYLVVVVYANGDEEFRRRSEVIENVEGLHLWERVR